MQQPPQYAQVPVTVQPAVVSQETTTVVVTQPTITQQWDSGLFACFDDVPSCLCSFFLGGCYYACLATTMGEHCCVGCSGHGAGIVPGGHVAMRAAFRNRHGIPGSICDDCLLMTFCNSCAMCQLARQMNRYGYEKKGCCS